MRRAVILRIVALALLLYALIGFGAARHELRQAERQTQRLQAELKGLEEENSRWQERLAAGFSDEEMRRLAWERLGMVLPGDKIFYFVPPEKDGT